MGQLLHIDQISHLKITNILFIEFFYQLCYPNEIVKLFMIMKTECPLPVL